MRRISIDIHQYIKCNYRVYVHILLLSTIVMMLILFIYENEQLNMLDLHNNCPTLTQSAVNV